MSFPVFRLLGAAGSALRAVNGFTKGPACAIGGVSLTRTDSPGSVPFGGSQDIVVHKIAGGSKVFHLMGATEKDIHLSGKLYGSGAVSKARQLDTMRKAGKKVRLTWGDFSRSVLIKSFECDYGRGGNILPYVVDLIVVPEEQPERTPTTLEGLGKSLADSLGLPDLTPTIAKVQEYAAAAQQALPVVAAISPGAAATVGGLLASGNTVLSGTLGLAEGRIASIGSVINGVTGGVTGMGGLVGIGGRPAARRAEYDAQTAKELALVVAARAHMGAAARAADDLGAGR